MILGPDGRPALPAKLEPREQIGIAMAIKSRPRADCWVQVIWPGLQSDADEAVHRGAELGVDPVLAFRYVERRLRQEAPLLPVRHLTGTAVPLTGLGHHDPRALARRGALEAAA